MTVVRKDNGWVCPQCTRAGRIYCQCPKDGVEFSTSSLAEEYRASQRRENARLAALLAFMAVVILIGAYFAA